MTTLPPLARTRFSRPFPDGPLIDNHGRAITYLRLGITDRCNLRCRYCMPANGQAFLPHAEILRFEEMERLVRIFAAGGIRKLRITGGEPFVRKDTLPFLKNLARIKGINAIHLTTNGVAVADRLEELNETGIAGINLSLDTLDRKRFWKITHRDFLDRVMHTFKKALALGIPLKINSVVQEGVNTGEIGVLAELARHYPIEVRFIELMPFSGRDFHAHAWTSERILAELKTACPGLRAIEAPGARTARLFEAPGFRGRVGIISGYSRMFCQGCNKVRITPVGMLKTCLYDDGALDLKGMLRSGAKDAEIAAAVRRIIAGRAANGFEAEARSARGAKKSMATIGG